GLDRARRRDVVGGDAVAEHGEDPGPHDVSYRFRVTADALEKGGPADVARRRPPPERLLRRYVEAPPVFVAGERLVVAVVEHVGADGISDGDGYFGRGGPDVAQEHRPAVSVDAERLVYQVSVEGSCERVGDDERWRGQ